MAVRRRTVTARKMVGKKTIKDKVYQYEYYTLPLNLYLPKSMIDKWGTEFVVERDDEKGRILIYSTRSTEK